MRKAVLTITILFLISPSASFQTQNARLAFRVTDHQRWNFRFEDNPLLDFDTVLRQSSTVVALRLCTKESLKTALGSSRRQVNSVINFLKEAYDYPPDRILILRGSECHVGSAPISATEVWVIRLNAMIPPASETITGRQALRLLDKRKSHRVP
jgi:hypothetical protein